MIIILFMDNLILDDYYPSISHLSISFPAQRNFNKQMLCTNPGTFKQATPHSQNQSQNNTPITILNTIKSQNTASNQFNQHNKTVQLKPEITRKKMANEGQTSDKGWTAEVDDGGWTTEKRRQ